MHIAQRHSGKQMLSFDCQEPATPPNKAAERFGPFFQDNNERRCRRLLPPNFPQLNAASSRNLAQQKVTRRLQQAMTATATMAAASAGTLTAAPTAAPCCPQCGFGLSLPPLDATQAALLEAQREIADLNAQVRLLNLSLIHI